MFRQSYICPECGCPTNMHPTVCANCSHETTVILPSKEMVDRAVESIKQNYASMPAGLDMTVSECREKSNARAILTVILNIDHIKTGR